MSTVVPTGDLGLDILSGGGFRLVERLPRLRSATVVVRGSAGAGKTLLGLQVAVALAGALGGDVLVACVEILPSEYAEQVRSSRPDLEPSVVELPVASAHVPPAAAPRIFCGLLADLDPDAPDLVAGLEALRRVVETYGGKSVAVVVDSLIDGYGIGVAAPRARVDAAMKFAAEAGVGLVLCEEASVGTSSPWAFAADTVLELGVEPVERGRWVEVKKHRFGASVSGRHELDLGTKGVPAVYPEPGAWITREVGALLRARGWRGNGALRAMAWDTPLGVGEPLEANGMFAVVSGEQGLARHVAWGLVPKNSPASADMVVALDPLILQAERGHEGSVDRFGWWERLPTLHGPARALRQLVEGFGLAIREPVTGPERAVRRVLVGDLGVALRSSVGQQWADAIRVFVSLVTEAAKGVLVVAFMEDKFAPASLLAVHSLVVAADVSIDVTTGPVSGTPSVSVGVRATGEVRSLTLPKDFEHKTFPHLDRLFAKHGADR